MTSPKSDKPAKQAFIEELRRRGFENPRVTASPADITAERAGETYYFEIKYTRRKTRYFGAATLTEWKAALAHSERFLFVVAMEKQDGWQFIEYTPEQFMQFSTIPPFKIFFTIMLETRPKRAASLRTRGTVKLNREFLKQMLQLYEKFRFDEKI
jgi:Holliday junction resolvase